VLVTGTVKMRDEDPQLVCEDVEEFVPSEAELTRREYLLRIRVPRGKSDVLELARLDQLMTALATYPGDDRYELFIRNGKWEARLGPSGRQTGVQFCPELMQRLEDLLGPNTVEPVQVS